jgi:hypothetical protein
MANKFPFSLKYCIGIKAGGRVMNFQNPHALPAQGWICDPFTAMPKRFSNFSEIAAGHDFLDSV